MIPARNFMLTTAFSYTYEHEATEETETISGLYEYHYTEQISLLFSLIENIVRTGSRI
jgi:hypothetical protein